ncbi:MAG: (Fe-S)-binding protein [Anaerolineales bacterium]
MSLDEIAVPADEIEVLEPVPEPDSDPETLVLDDELWEQLIELTGGAAAPCFQCGVCTATCPWGTVRDEPISVRKLMRQAQVGLISENEGLWLCTACAQCEPYCPRGVPIVEVFRGLRYLAWERREALEGLPSVLWSVYWNNNPLSQPPSQRTAWIENGQLPDFDPAQHEFLLYVGCTSSYDRRAQNVARSVVKLLNASGVKYGVLGEGEPCCGEAVLSMGHSPFFEEVAAKATAIFQEHGVQKIVAISPHCYDVFRNHYDALKGAVEVYHYTQLLADLVESDQLEFGASLSLKATFHDPCLLGRSNNEYEAPRKVIGAIPSIEMVEMEHAGIDSLCCGGGGGRMWMETEAGERFSDLRVREAVDVGAEVVVTACPSCIACLEDSAKAQGLKELRVLDVAELAVLNQESPVAVTVDD